VTLLSGDSGGKVFDGEGGMPEFGASEREFGDCFFFDELDFCFGLG